MKIQIKQDVGMMDRCFRICIGIVMIGLGTFLIKGTIGTILMIFSIPLLASGITGFCPSYTIFGISTKRESSCC